MITFWSPSPTPATGSIGLPFIRAWVLGETAVILDDFVFHNRVVLVPWQDRTHVVPYEDRVVLVPRKVRSADAPDV